MGVGLNTMLAAVGAGGVAASKIAQGSSEAGEQARSDFLKKQKQANEIQVAQAVDADRAEQAKIKAEYQVQRLKNMKLQNKNLRLRNRMMKDTLRKNQDVKPDEQK